MIKKIISALLVFSIATSFALVPTFAVNENTTSYTAIIEGQEITYTVYQSEQRRYVNYVENGKAHSVIYDFSSGCLTLDGTLVCSSITLEDMQLSPGVSTNATYTWKYYETTYGDLTSSVISVASWTALIVGLVGVAVPVATEIAEKLFAKHIPTVYYKRLHYYKDPIITSRPETASVYMFYSDAEYDDYIGTIDMRT